MKKRFKIGDKVQPLAGPRAGEHGVIECRPDPTMRRHFDWCVLYPDGASPGYLEAELTFATVARKHRPIAVGALKAGSR
jgi:hypothetical protein